MRIGLWLTARHVPGLAPESHFANLRQQVRLAREGGFALISSGQHHLSPRLQTIPLLAALSHDAGTMDLATSILQLPLHHPVDVAEEAATVNAMVDGRFILGIGLGHDELERTVYGVAAAAAASRFVEAADIMGIIWRGEGTAFKGRHFDLPWHPGRTAPARPPRVWVGGGSRAAIRRAAAYGWAWFPSNVDATAVREGRKLLAAESDGSGPHRDMPVGLWMHIASSDRAAASLAARAGHGSPPRGAVIGSPGRCLDTLLDLKERAGVTHVLCRLEVPGMDPGDIFRSIETIGNAVIPSIGRS